MRQPDAEFGAEHDPGEVARIIGVNESDLLKGHPPQTVSTGNPFCIVALESLAALERLAIPQQQATPWLRERNARWFYCIAADETHRGWRARMQWQSGEDPATGSAAGPCIAWLVRRGLAPSGAQVAIRQGVEMKRPSLLTVQATVAAERITDVLVGGRTIPVATGTFFLPA